MTAEEIIQLSKTISHALRHEPWLYELEIDNEGWVLVETLLSSLRAERTEWSSLGVADLEKLLTFFDKKRFELKNEKIRALYGHSIPKKLLKQPALPPITLYHGTAVESAASIKIYGLRPMGRQYVHMSVEVETAREVGRRKSKSSIVLTILAQNAYNNGLSFYPAGEFVWLADYVLSNYIQFTGHLD
ncbi:RNA 2'-phosphotransferase [Anthocerotibacter panamensis]|uniref:RNA 2'-phosphotransferase n=1 Tax=Anthocerotibacter panamensis TaxID=2857077 RepID=UPI001C40194F|nr:RNA 2'-phosphotransferase [Anthocerotibacter panamensis]